MAVTSGTYNFTKPASVQIIQDAYQRIGMWLPEITGEQLASAQRSLNFCLQSWINKGNNLWTSQDSLLGLVTGQASYQLPITTSDVVQCFLRTSNRNLGGTPFSSSGVAANAFDGNPATACTQNAINGNIGYNWVNTQYAISMVGIQSNATLTYTLVAEYSNDNINWDTVLTIPAQSCPIGTIMWFSITAPTMGQLFRIRETGGATLNIQELYLNTQVNDTMMGAVSKSEYQAYPMKNQPGRPSTYFVDRQISPVLNIWPVPISIYNCLFFTQNVMIQDIGTLLNAPQIPPRFMDALTSDLAYRLGGKNPDKADATRRAELKAEADEAFRLAYDEDRERVPLRIYGSYMQGWFT